MCAHAKKCYSSAKKIIQFKFFSFQRNILRKYNRYLNLLKRTIIINNKKTVRERAEIRWNMI